VSDPHRRRRMQSESPCVIAARGRPPRSPASFDPSIVVNSRLRANASIRITHLARGAGANDDPRPAESGTRRGRSPTRAPGPRYEYFSCSALLRSSALVAAAIADHDRAHSAQLGASCLVLSLRDERRVQIQEGRPQLRRMRSIMVRNGMLQVLTGSTAAAAEILVAQVREARVGLRPRSST